MSHQVFSGAAFRKTCFFAGRESVLTLGQGLPVHASIESLHGRKRVDRGAFNDPADRALRGPTFPGTVQAPYWSLWYALADLAFE